MKRIYLDNAAGTPIDKHVFSEMEPFLKGLFGNPSTLYEEGVVAKRAIDKAREDIAGIVVAHKDEIYFTGSGTEADNIALKSVALAKKDDGNPHKSCYYRSIIEGSNLRFNEK